MNHKIVATIRNAYTNQRRQNTRHCSKFMNKEPRVTGMNTNIRESFFNRPIGFL